MNTRSNRRSFLRSSVLACGALALPRLTLGIEPFKRPGEPRLLLSLAAYSFREYFVDTTEEGERKIDPARRIDLFQFIDFCAEHGCQGAELTSYYFPKEVSAEYLLKLRRHAFLRGVSISGTAVGNTFTSPPGAERDRQMAYVKKWIDHASTMGAPHLRVFAGETAKGLGKEESKKLCLAALEECARYAGDKGIFLGLENHGGIVAEAEDLLELVRSSQSPWVGINLDTGNFHTDDPYADLARCAPYAVNVQLKAEIRARRGRQEKADLARLLQILRDARYQGYVAVEYESQEDPWKALPPLLEQCRKLMQ